MHTSMSMNNVAAVMSASVNIIEVTRMRSRFGFGAACATTLPTTYNGAATIDVPSP